MADAKEFEARLREALPRGLGKAPASRGRDRGVRACWLLPEEMQGGDDSDWKVSDCLIGDALMLGWLVASR